MHTDFWRPALAAKNQYLKSMIDKVENLVEQLWWKAFFFENPDAIEERSEDFGLKPNLTHPQHKHLTSFENVLSDKVCNIEFKTGQNNFQRV